MHLPSHRTGTARSKALRLSLTVGIVILIGGAIWLHRSPAQAANTDASKSNPGSAKESPALTVATVRAKSANWATIISAAGNIAPWQEAIIGAQVGGLRIDAIKADIGDQVKRGQVLALLDADLLRTELAQLQASANQAQANKVRALKLKDSGSISEQEILQFVTQADITEAQLRTKQLQLSYATVRAPDHGVISAKSATLGAVVGNGQELFRLIRQNRLEWRAELTAQQLTHITPGQQVTLSLPDGSTARATVRKSAPATDAQTRLTITYADIAAGSSARAGMYASGKIAQAPSPALVLPATCVVLRDGRNQVFLLQANGRVKAQVVQIGRRQGDEVEIASGITAGQDIVSQGAGFLNDGDLVLTARAAGASAASSGKKEKVMP